MRWILVLVGIGVSLQICRAQGDTVTLQSLERNRSTEFLRQKGRALGYVTRQNKPISTLDEKGNYLKVVGLTTSGLPIYLTTLNAGAAITSGAAQLAVGGSLGLNLQGSGMVVGVWDAGLVKDHVELGSRVIAKEGAIFFSHSTHVTGTLIATGVNAAAKGMAPLAQAITKDFDNDEAEMAALAKPDQTSLLFSNHSYGTVTGWFKNGNNWDWSGDKAVNALEDYRFGFYDYRAQTIDQIAALSPYYTIVWATGNDRADIGDGTVPADCNGGSGYDCIIPEAVAKNIISVGAVEKVPNYANPFDVTMSFFSSWGPTDDGRIKPDLVGAGVNLFSLSAAGTNGYTTMSGTSMATPNVAGSLMLLQELYGKIHGGKRMKAATLKALAIHTAKEAGNFPGPDYSFGWGLLDVEAGGKILLKEDAENTFVSELSLKNGGSFTMSLVPRANQKITATIAWTDPAGIVHGPMLDPVTPNLVNDLDLRIIDDQGREQLPWTLNPTNPSSLAVPGDNFRDNVEKLEFNNPEGKTYSLVVRHKGVLTNNHQDFSLILSYQSTSTTNTFYWIGDSGSWSDGNHWSLSSKGVACLQIPGAGDHAIVDENSFDGIGNDVISFTQDASCSSLLWMNSKPSGISLNNNAINITGKCIFSTTSFFAQTKGKIVFLAGTSAGNFESINTDLTNLTLDFNSGIWNIIGKIKADEMRMEAGGINISSSVLSLARFNVNSNSSKTLKLNNSLITLTESSSLDGSLTVTSANSTLIIDTTTVNLLWQGFNFPGEIQVGPKASVTVNGNNEIGKLLVSGRAKLNGSNQIDTLIMNSGSELDLGPSTVQTLTTQSYLNGNSLNPVTIIGVGPSNLQFPDHSKLCFDFLNVSNVGIVGSGLVNAGIHSTLSGADQWLQEDCDAILFADFEQIDNCVGGLTEFTNKSSGNITTFSWTFGDNGPVSHDLNPARIFMQAGSIPVTLEISDGTTSSLITKNIQIIENTLASNQIVANGSSLGSFIIAKRYQWFKDGIALPGSKNRFISLDGSDGSYFVVAYDNVCNISSDTVTITGLNSDENEIRIYPNPVSDWVTIKLPTSSRGSVTLFDLFGRRYVNENVENSETRLSMHSVADGIYLLEVTMADQKVRRRIMVLHGSQ